MRRARRALSIPQEKERRGRGRSRDLLRMFQCGYRSQARLWWQVPFVVRTLTFPPCEITSFNKPEQIIQAHPSAHRGKGSADLQRKVDCCAAMETGLVLNPIIKQRLSNNRSRPTCTKDILGCGLIPELCRTDFALCRVIWMWNKRLLVLSQFRYQTNGKAWSQLLWWENTLKTRPYLKDLCKYCL